MKLHPYLSFDGNAKEAFDFYKSVFGGEFTSVVTFGGFPMEGVEVSEADKDKIMHIGLQVGENILMASDTVTGFGEAPTAGANFHISVQPDSKEEADRIFNSLSQGADIGMPIAPQPWGDYYGHLTDKFGIHWMVNYSTQQS